MKQRFSSLDLTVIAHELAQTITAYRLANIYDLTSRIFLLKFARPESKHLLLVDSGFRCHLTSFARATATTPSSFVAKLRRCLRTRRVTGVRQLDTDRVLELEFSAGEFRLYLEFYAGGNVVLADKEGVVVAVLRVVKGGEDGAGECKVGAKYVLSERGSGEGDLRGRVVGALEAAVAEEGAEGEGAAAALQGAALQGAGRKFKKKKKKKGEDSIKKVLSARMSEFSPTLIEHCFCLVGLDPDLKAEEALADERKLEMIVRAFGEAEKTIADILAAGNDGGIKGYIVAKTPRTHNHPDPTTPPTTTTTTTPTTTKGVSFGSSEAVEQEHVEKVQQEGEAKGLVYDDFFPFLPTHLHSAPGVKCLEFTGYNHTVDSFFSSIESQKLTSRIAERELAAGRKIASAHADHMKRVEGLRGLQELNVLKAQAIEANLDRVEEVIAAVNGLVAQGMDWVAMGRLVEAEQRRGNAVAELIRLPLKLYENTVTVVLGEGSHGDSDHDDDDDEEEEEEEEEGGDGDGVKPTPPSKPHANTLDIDLNLDLSAYANASLYFTQKKTLLIKETKTLSASTQALTSTSRKIAADLAKTLKHEKALLRPLRQPLWFEKFLFFVSSDGYLVLAGRDAQQKEMLYRRYFRRGDVYVCADVDGAASVVVKNRGGVGDPVPPGTLSQAGTLAVATSRAWEAKGGMGAWWVGFEQVGKVGEGGYLPVGVFEVRGVKNYLPPAQLVLGYGVMWMVDEEGRKRHGRHRMEEGEGGDWGEEKVEGTVEGEAEQKDGGNHDEMEEEQDDSDDEEFPDAKIESAGEEEAGEEESDDEEFPDTEIKEKEPEPEAEASEGDQEDGAQEDETPASPARGSGAGTPSGSKHLSAKERRELKKARAAGGVKPSTPTPEPTSKPKAPPPTKPDQTPAKVRGKKGKQKKQATKYAHQDAEDRALAMEVLGSASAKAKAEEAALAKEAKEAEMAANKARRRDQHARAAREGLKAEEARRRREGAGGDDNAEEEEEEEDPSTKVPLDCFVGTPMQGDNLLEAIPVCAPWGAMGRFKYKAKLQPGSVKKGKAVKDVVARWLAEGEKKMDMKSLDPEKMWPRERELIKGWREAEIINCVGVSKVKVFGGSAGAAGGGAGKGSGGGGKRGGRGGKRK